MPAAKNEIKFEQPSDLLVLANRFVLVIVAVIVLVVLAIGYFFILQPSINNIKSQNSATQESARLQGRNEELLTRLKELKAEYENIKNNRTDVLHRLESIIPQSPQTAELFVMAEKLAKDRGLILTSLEIVENQNEVTPAATSTAPASDLETTSNVPPQFVQNIGIAAPTQTNSVNLKSLVIHLSLMTPAPITDKEGKIIIQPNAGPTESTYSIFKKFLNDLEQNLRLMDIQTVSFGALDAGPDSTALDVSLVAYYK